MSRSPYRPPGKLVFTTADDKNVSSTEVLPRNFAGSIVAIGQGTTISETVSRSFAATDPILLIGAAPITARAASLATARTSRILAADGGAEGALTLGLTPDLIVGDLDSLKPETRAHFRDVPLLHDPDQDTTDFEKALARIKAPLILAIGVTGGRFDHSLAAMSALAGPLGGNCIILAETDIIFMAPPDLRLDLAEGTRVSLYPMGEVRGRSQGLAWPLDGLDLSPSGRIGTSNRATGPVSLQTQGPLLVILPLDCLDAAMTALGAGSARSR